MNKRIVGAALGTLLLVSGAAFAQSDQDAVVKYRQAVMKILGWHIGPVAGMAKGEMAFDNVVLTHHANAMAAAALISHEGFPEGSGPVEGSKAKAEIWGNAADFQAKSQALIDATTALAAAAPTVAQADLGALLGAVGGACKGCHEAYRAQ